MKIALASTWTPRGDLPRFKRVLPRLDQIYDALFIAVRSGSWAEAEELKSHPTLTMFEMPAPGWGRYLVLQRALAAGAAYIHAADLDMLVHWIESNPREWLATVALIQQAECLIIGRTARAFQTRPQAIQQTEHIINRVFSHVLGQTMDFGLGARGYSRQAAQCIIGRSQPDRWGDAEWPVLIQQAGLPLTYCEVDGVEWETPDRYGDEVADEATRQSVARAYDQDAAHWARRVKVAQEIIGQGLAVVQHWP